MPTLYMNSLIFLLVALGWGARGFGAQVPGPWGKPRIVNNHPANWISITFNVFGYLIESDVAGKLMPRLATGHIKQRYEQGMNTSEIARQLGIGRTSVRRMFT